MGDLFITGDRIPKKGYIVNYFYNEEKKQMTYGVFFSTNDNKPVGNDYPEYTNEELKSLIKEGNTIPFLENSNEPKLFGNMIKRYQSNGI